MLAPFVYPGAWLLSKLFIPLDSPATYAVALILSLWVWTTALRLLYSAVGRLTGLFDPRVFGWFLWIPWRPFYRRVYRPLRAWVAEHYYGLKDTAAWASLFERMSLLYKPGCFAIGRLRVCGVAAYQILGLEIQRHVMIYGLTGANKTNTLVTTAAMWPGSTIICDVGGAATRVLHRRNSAGAAGIFGKGHRSFTLDPNHQSGIKTSCYDPMLGDMRAAVKRARKRDKEDVAVRWAGVIAEGLIPIDNKETKKFFPLSARAFLEGLILFVFETSDTPNLPAVRDYLMNGHALPENAPDDEKLTPWTYLLFLMGEHTEKYGGVIAKRANAIRYGGRESSADILATARNATAWLDFPSMRRVMVRADFSFARHFKQGKAHLTICGSIGDLAGPLAPWYRLMVKTVIYAFETTPGKPSPACLLCADEMQNLGRIEVLAKAPSHLRKHGLAFVGLAQDVTTMLEVYPNLESINGNTDFILWFPTECEDNIDLLMKKLGKRTLREKVQGGPFGSDRPHYRIVERDLIYRSQLKGYLDPARGNVIATVTGRRPILLKAVRYFADLPLYHFEPDLPAHPEKGLRAKTRQLLERLIPAPKAGRQQAPELLQPLMAPLERFGAALSQFHAHFL